MLNKFFKLDENNTDLKTELLAGLTTFLAMAYILGVNPTMLAEGGMPATGVFFATALASGVSCIIMGLISKYPVGLAPGMGMNALFTYTIILTMGNTWETALAAVFVSSIIFLLITISGLREAILNALPFDLKLAIGAGIGFFLAFIGLKGAGIIVADPATLVGMGTILSAPALLAVIGILLTLVLYIKKVPAAVFLGLVITAILGVIFTLAGFGAGDPIMPAIPTEFISFSFDTSVVGAFATGFTQLFSNIPNLIMILFSLLFVTFFDTTGTLIPLANQCGFIDENGNLKDGIKLTYKLVPGSYDKVERFAFNEGSAVDGSTVGVTVSYDASNAHKMLISGYDYSKEYISKNFESPLILDAYAGISTFGICLSDVAKKVVTVEEHSIIGGLGSAVAEVLCEECPVPMRRVGTQDVFGQSGKPAPLLEMYGLTAENIAKQAEEVIKLKK